MLCAEYSRIERYLIIFRKPPLGFGVIFIIRLALFILVAQSLLGRLLSLSIVLEYMLFSLFQTRVNKDLQAIIFMIKNIIGASSDDYARSFLGKLTNNLSL